MTNKPLMACGHYSNATRDGKPVCCICAGDPRSMEIVDVYDFRKSNARTWGKSHYQEYLEKMKELKK